MRKALHKRRKRKRMRSRREILETCSAQILRRKISRKKRKTSRKSKGKNMRKKALHRRKDGKRMTRCQSVELDVILKFDFIIIFPK